MYRNVQELAAIKFAKVFETSFDKNDVRMGSGWVEAFEDVDEPAPKVMVDQFGLFHVERDGELVALTRDADDAARAFEEAIEDWVVAHRGGLWLRLPGDFFAGLRRTHMWSPATALA